MYIDISHNVLHSGCWLKVLRKSPELTGAVHSGGAEILLALRQGPHKIWEVQIPESYQLGLLVRKNPQLNTKININLLRLLIFREYLRQRKPGRIVYEKEETSKTSPYMVCITVRGGGWHWKILPIATCILIDRQHRGTGHCSTTVNPEYKINMGSSIQDKMQGRGYVMEPCLRCSNKMIQQPATTWWLR